MSGGEVAYHLRKNKAVDRNTFFEFLSMLNTQKRLNEYQYISLGGPFLEDLKQLHSQLGLTNLISLEQSEEVVKRQMYNQPYSCIKCIETNSSRYITENNFDKSPNIIWLDYASAKSRPQQLVEVDSLLRKLKAYDVLKVTINANPITLFNKDFEYDQRTGRDIRLTSEAKEERRLDTLKQTILSKYLPTDLEIASIKTANFPSTLSKIIHHVTKESLKDKGLIAQPILSFRYNDSSHQMYTITMLLLPKDPEDTFKREEFLDLIRQWEVSTTSWGECKEIAVPDMTPKEKFLLDQQLPCKSVPEIVNALPFKFSENEQDHLKQIASYKLFYRSLSHFTKVIF